MVDLAPSLLRLLAEVDARWPTRTHVFDGWQAAADFVDIGTAHVPDGMGRVWDVDFDTRGLDSKALLKMIAQHPATVHFAISNGLVVSANFGMKLHRWTGDQDSFRNRAHISLHRTPAAWQGPAGWGVADLTELTGAGASRLAARSTMNFARGGREVASNTNSTAQILQGLSKRLQQLDPH